MNLKKIFMLMLVALTAITSSCKYDDDELWDTVNSLADRISALETLTKQMNSDIAAMQSVISALENKVYVSQVEKLTDGYIIHFTDGTSATIKNGVDGLNGKDAPVIDVKQENGVYYWTITVDGETTWLTDEKGNKLPVSGTAGTNGTNGKNGVTPLLKVDNDGYWMVSYNNGSSYTYVLDSNGDKVYAVGPQGPAGADGTNGTNGTNGSQGKPGDSMFKSVEVEGDKVIITLNDGKDTKIELPIASGVTYSIVDSEEEVDINSIKMTSNGSVTLKYEVSKMSDVTVEVLVANGVTVDVDRTKQTITIKRESNSEYSIDNSKVVLLYYNNDQTLTSVLKFTGVWDGHSVTAVKPEGDTYTISTPEQLAWIAKQVNEENNSFTGKTIVLTNNIDLNNEEWTPIGNKSNSTSFAGTIDGGGYVISNLKVTSGTYAGLIGRVAMYNSFEIKNLTISGATLSADNNKDGEYSAGAFVGWYDIHSDVNITLTQCHVINAKFTSTKYVGGLVGYKNPDYAITITNCSVKDCEFISEYTEDNSTYKGHCGGVIGYLGNGTISGTEVSGCTFTVKGNRGGLLIGSAEEKAVIGTGNKVSNNTGLTSAVGSLDYRTDKTTNVEGL